MGELALSRDERLLASGGGDGTIRLWDLSTGEQRAMGSDRSRILGLAWSEEDRRLLSVSEKFLRIWDGATGEELLVLHPGDTDYLTSVASVGGAAS